MAEKKLKQPVDKSTVRLYKHFEELRDCLASGWSAPMVRAYMIERYGSAGVPHEKAIQRWRDRHLPDALRVVPHQVVTRILKGVEYKVDVIGHLSRLIALCEDRVARGLSQEDQFAGMPLAVNDGVMQTYLQAIRDYVNVAQDLGIMKAPSPFLIDARIQQLVVTPETLQAFKDTIMEIRRIESAGYRGIEASHQEDDQKAGSVSSAEGGADG